MEFPTPQIPQTNTQLLVTHQYHTDGVRIWGHPWGGVLKRAKVGGGGLVITPTYHWDPRTGVVTVPAELYDAVVFGRWHLKQGKCRIYGIVGPGGKFVQQDVG